MKEEKKATITYKVKEKEITKNERKGEKIMKNKEKSFLTYIEHGKEITKNITKWNREFLFEKICDKVDERFGEYSFKDSIEYIHLKNITFPYINTTKIKLKEHQILILENCIFEGYKLNIYQGNVEIINPNFAYENLTVIKTDYLKDFSITLNKNTNKKEFLNLNINAKNIELDANLTQYLYEVWIEYAETVTLKNLVGPIKEFNIEADQEINFQGQNHIISYRNVSLETEYLSLGDSIIETKHIPYVQGKQPSLKIETSNLTGENYQLISENTIYLNNSIYTKPKSQKNIVITKETLEKENIFEQRRKMISILKGIQKYYQSVYEEYGNNLKRQAVHQLEHQSIGTQLPKIKQRKK